MAALVQVIENSQLGEGPHWNANRQELIYVDIEKTEVRRYVPSTGLQTKVSIDGSGYGVGMVIPVEGQDNQFIVARGRDLRLMEWDGESSAPTTLTTLVSVEDDLPANRFNDGKVDALGRLWAGTISGSGDNSANLYKIDKGVVTLVQSDIGTSNGIAWNSSNTLMYYNDTNTNRVDVFDFDLQNGTISNRRPVYDFSEKGEAGSPDGMTIDADGNLFVGCWGGKQIIQINPSTGQKIRSIPFPADNITSAAFGGPNLDILYVTSAYSGLNDQQRAAQPAAGALFAITNLGVKGQAGGNNYVNATKKKWFSR